ncbi:MAG TPA: sigma-70 family RNA polymerase sigma factor [Acidimicrobiales bacterium]|nr:sigma-70 family RNA polymerase sigma factor [Acidimicrobiales bacterium]
MEPEPPLEGVGEVDGILSYSVVAETELSAEPVVFVDFYGKARDRVARALALTLNDGDLAAEAVDEAMARAYQRWDRIATFDDPAGWVYRVALNWATSVLRRRTRAPHPPAEPLTTDMRSPAEPAVLAALAELDVRQRAAVVCRYYLGFSESETAAALGIRPGTVKSRLHRALQHLQVRLAHLRNEES